MKEKDAVLNWNYKQLVSCAKHKVPLKKGRFGKYCPECNHQANDFKDGKMSFKKRKPRQARKGQPAYNSKGKKKNRKVC